MSNAEVGLVVTLVTAIQTIVLELLRIFGARRHHRRRPRR